MKNSTILQRSERATTVFTYLLFAIFLLITGHVNAQSVNEKLFKQVNSSPGFIENKGQIIDQDNKPNPVVKYLFSMPGLNVQLRANGFSYDAYVIDYQKKEKTKDEIPGTPERIGNITVNFQRIDIEFIGANTSPQLIAELPGSDYMNYYTTGTPEGGVTYVKHYGKVTYKDLYPGIDLVFVAKPGENKPVEYSFIVHPGADLSLVKWKYTGGNSVKIKDGNIDIQTVHGILKESIPLSYEKETGKTVDISYRELGDGVYAFNCANDQEKTLVIDPTPNIQWATFYGGSGNDQAYGVSYDSSGNVYVVGETTSTSNIATTGTQQSTYGGGSVHYNLGGDAFLVKFSPTGNLIWGTYYGGTAEDLGYSIRTNKAGDSYIVGDTQSSNAISTTGAFQVTFGGGSYHDPFLAKFNTSGIRQWGTYFGGTGNDRATVNGMAMDDSGNVFITGTNNTANNSAITSPGCYQSTNGSTSAYDEPFAAKFNPSGTRVWGTYYGGGGSYHDQGYAIAVDDSFNVYLAGATTTPSTFASTGAYQTALAGGTDAFLVKLNSTGTARIWGTYYGGTGNDYGRGIAVDKNGNVFLSGYTSSTAGIATTGAYQTTFGGGSYDGFLVRFTNTGSRVWGTYYGGGGADVLTTLSLNPQGDLLWTGYTDSTSYLSGLATTGAYQTTYGGGTQDGLIAKFTSAGIPKWCTFYGGNLQDLLYNHTLDKTGNIYIVGKTVSTTGMSTSGAYQTTNAGGTMDGFVAKFKDGSPVRITSATTIQPDTSGVSQGNTNKMIIGIKIYTIGYDTMAKVTRFSFDTAGTFNYSNITGTAKVYYTGNSATFSTGNLYGSTSGTPSAAFTITGNKTIDTGVVYFWLTFDVSSTATIGNYLDAKCTQVRWDSAGTTLYKTPVIISPAGRRRIVTPPKTLNSIAYTQPSISYVYRNTTNNPVLRLDINVTGTGGTLYLSQVTVAAKNTSTSDVTNVKLYATTTTTFSSSTQVGSASTFSGGTATFSSLNYSLPTGTTYIWITYDIPLTAPIYDTIDAKIPINGITIGGSTYPSTEQNPTGYRIINTNQYDAGIAAITSPVAPYCNLHPSIKVALKNYGTTTLTSDTIRWTINGATQAPYYWTGSLTFGNSANVTLGSYTFSSGMSYIIRAYTSKRLNGTYIDSFPGNDTAKVNITFSVVPVPGFTVNDSFQCYKGNLFVFTNTSTISVGTFTSYWNFGDSTTSLLTSPTHSYLYVNTFPVKLVVSSLSGCKDSIIRNMSLKPSPVAAFSIADTSKCLRGNTFSFTNNSTISSGTFTNLWKFGDNTTSPSVSPSHSYLATGTYQVKLITTSNLNCKDSIAKNVYVRPHPVTSFTVNDSDQCLRGNSFVFNNSTGISSGTFTNLWKFGDNTTSVNASPTKTYTNTGSYIVKLVTTSNYGCKDSITGNTYVYPHPLTVFTISDSSQCKNGNAFVFSNNSSISSGSYTNLWKFGDNTTSTNTSPSKSYNNTGTYNVKLVTTSDKGCKDSMTKNTYVRPHPITAFNINDTNQCLRGNLFVFTNKTSITSGTYNNSWNFGDNTTSIVISPTKTYLTTGTYVVKLVTTSNYGCKDSLSKNVHVNPHPVTSLAIKDTAECFRGNSFDYTNKSTIPAGTFTSLWKFGDNTTSTSSPATHTYMSYGTFTVKLINTSNYGCKDSSNAKVYVYATPQAAFTIPVNKQCLNGNLFNFNNTSVIGSGTMTALWKFGDNQTSTTYNTTHSYLGSDTFTVYLIVLSDKACKDSTSKTVIVYPQPKAGYLLADTGLCLRNNLFQFTDDTKIINDTISGYEWKFGDGNSDNLKNTFHSYITDTIYTFTHTVTSSNGCKDSISGKVYVYPMPKADFTVSDTSLCKIGNLFIFTNGSIGGNLSYLWLFGDGNTSTDTNATHSYANSGIYNVRLAAITSNNCFDTFELNVHVKDNPVVNLGKDTTIKDNQSITLDAGAGFDSYLWSNSRKSRWIVVDTTGNGLGTKLYWVKVMQNGCDGYDSINITIVKHVSIDDPQANFSIRIYPNPAMDFLNIEYGAIRKDLTVSLTDMNGKLLRIIRFRSTDSNNHYQMDISKLATGVYYLNFLNSEVNKVVKIMKY